MHISEGVLSGEVCLAGFVATTIIGSLTLRKVPHEDIPKISVVTAAIFIASLVHIKIGPASVHLMLNGLAGILLGYGAFPSVIVALLFQAVMFGHGGITPLGVNAIIIGIPALFAFYLFQLKKISYSKKFLLSLSFAIGVFYVLLTVVLGALILITTGKEFIFTAKLLIYSHIPLIIIEAVICTLTVAFLYKVSPNILGVKHPENAGNRDT